MQKLVDKVYQPKQLDKLRKVSRFEFEQREVRQQLDLANIFLQLEKISDALDKNGINVVNDPNFEDDMVNMVIEDRQAVSVDLMDKEYFRRQTALEKGSLVEKARKLIFGAPVSSEEALENQNIKVTVEPDHENAEKINTVINMISKIIPKSADKAVEPEAAMTSDEHDALDKEDSVKIWDGKESAEPITKPVESAPNF